MGPLDLTNHYCNVLFGKVWCWSHPRTGVSLTRGGALLVDDEGEAPDPK